MTAITFFATSKPFSIPSEIMGLYNCPVFESEEDAQFFTVQTIVDAWEKELEGIFSLPYLYEVEGVGTRFFLMYLEKYLEIGDVFEIYRVPDQHSFQRYVQAMQEDPAPILVNIGKHTYQDRYGCYQLGANTWLEELSHRNYISQHGITTFVKCE